MMEGYIKTVVQHIRKIILTNRRDWDDRLLLFLMTYRAATYETRGMSAGMVIRREQCLQRPSVWCSPRQGQTYN
jgi:hypothetical protein